MIIKVGNSAYNPKFFRSIHLVEDDDGVMVKIIAVTDRGQKIVLKKVNLIESNVANPEAYILEWFKIYVKMMEEK